MSKTLLKLNGYGGILKVIIEVVVIVIFAWTFIQVRDIPVTFATKLEVRLIKKEIQSEMERIIAPMRTQVRQIYAHLLENK